MKPCTCKIPKSFADPRKRSCRECGGRIFTALEEGGRLHTKVDSALSSLSGDDHEKAKFIAYLSETIGESIRQNYLTWTHNRAVEAAKPATMKQ